MRTRTLIRCSRLGGVGGYVALSALMSIPLHAQNSTLSNYFEGKQVTVRLDMPGTQQGVDIFPQKPQTLDTKSYASRLKKFGVGLRNGDQVMITKIKVKDDNIEFQLGGGGYGTAFDDTDTSVHFTPADKSSREKDLENQLNNETDPDRRRSLQRELDRVRDDRARDDRRAQRNAEQAAADKRQEVDMRRERGGSRFNIRIDTKRAAEELTPQYVMTALAPYVTFPQEAFGGAGVVQPVATSVTNPGGPPPPPSQVGAPPPPPAALQQQGAGDLGKSLHKGLTRAQVEALFGPAVEAHDRTQDNMTITSCTYQSRTESVQADFVNGVLVQYTISSR